MSSGIAPYLLAAALMVAGITVAFCGAILQASFSGPLGVTFAVLLAAAAVSMAVGSIRGDGR